MGNLKPKLKWFYKPKLKTKYFQLNRAADSMAALNVFELFDAQVVARHGDAMETTLVVVIIGLLTGILVNVLMLWGAHIQGGLNSTGHPIL